MSLVNIPYLEGEDINDDGSLKSHVGNGKPVIVMMQGNFCGYCNQAKPEFQKLVGESKIVACTVQVDGEAGDKEANKKLSAVNKAPGVPAYLGFDMNGKYRASHNGERTAQALLEFANSLQ